MTRGARTKRSERPRPSGDGVGPSPGRGRRGAWAWRLLPWGLTIAAGGALSLAWAPYRVAPLAVVGVALLLVALRAPSLDDGAPGPGPGRRFLLGWLGGAVAFGTAFHWVYDTMRDMSGLPPLACAGAVLLFALLHGLLWAALALAIEPLRRWSGGLWLLTVPTLWVLGEWLFPFLFPIYVGYGLWATLPLVQVADLAGPAGPSFLVVLVAAGLVEAGARWRRDRRRAWRPLAVAAGALVLATAYGLVRMAQVDGAAESDRLRIAVVQHVPTLAEKRSPDPAVRWRMLQKALDLTRPLVAQRGALDAVIWPEGTFPYPLPDLGAAPAPGPPADRRDQGGRAVRALARDLGTDFVLGSLRRVEDRTRNTATLLPAAGGPPEAYDKVVLLAFGEYMPFSDVFPALRNSVPGIGDLQPGRGQAWFRLGGHDALVTICYEAILPGFVRRGLVERGELVLNLTNDIWFGRTRALDLHLMGQAFRTIENRVPLVRATTTGISALVDETGALVAHTEKLEPRVLTVEVPLRAVGSPYRALGDLVLWLLVAASAAVVAVRGRRRRAGTSA
jgi:apolipoprotein N-acyltransferase